MFGYIYGSSLLNLTLITVVVIFLVAHMQNKFKENFKKRVFNFCFFSFCCIVVIIATLFNRSSTHYNIELRPFYTFVMAQEQVEYYRTFFMNALLFVPLGLSMPYVLSKKPRKWPVFVTIAFAAVLSAVIEFLQYYYHFPQ